ncbi:MAG: hypothetical protein IKK20_02670 [Clostridia bacterium]|nr:hypothetical protein [Clostridia bacterium]
MFFNCRNRAFTAGRHLGGGGALYSHLNDASRNETASSKKFSQTTPQNANNAQNGALSPQEQLLAGTGLGLDPENDPVVYTTDYGLEIKYANALTNTNLASYTYFEAGGYNWVIIGYDSSVSSFVGDFSGETRGDLVQGQFSQSSTVDNSPAGQAIRKEMWAISSSAKPNEEIGDGCVLCLAEMPVDDGDGVAFNINRSDGNCYKDSNLQKWIDDFHINNLSYLPIISQDLKTIYSGASSGANIGSCFLFPLAGANNSETFYYESYLNQSERVCGRVWGLRSGYTSSSDSVYSVGTDGSVSKTNYNYYVTYMRAVRPAFVLKI